MDSYTIADVDAFLRLGIGDAGRLHHIRSMMQDGRELYNSDKKYLEMLQITTTEATKHIGQDSVEPAASQPARIKPDAKTTQDERAPEPASQPARIKPDAKTTQDERAPEPASPSARESVIIINQSPKSSAAWYLLPIFFNILGGLISYLCLRKQDPPRARKTLILGGVLSIIPLFLLAAVLWFAYDEYAGTTVPVIDLTEDQIKENALQVSYTLLVEESDLYRGELIEYEGDVAQVLDNFNSYVLRVDVSDGSTDSGSMWSNFAPKTDEEEEWVEGLKRTQNPFDLDPDTVRIWGTFEGLRDHETIFGATRTIPEVDVHLLERVEP